MTLLEAFIFKSGGVVSSADATNHLAFAGLDPSAQYDPNNQEQKCLFYGALLGYMAQDNVGVKSISEGGYSISYDKDQKAKYLSDLADESGCSSLIDKYNSKVVVKDMSHLW